MIRSALILVFLVVSVATVTAEQSTTENSSPHSFHRFGIEQLQVDLSHIHTSPYIRKYLYQKLGPPDRVTVIQGFIDNDPTYEPLIDTWQYGDYLEIRFVSDRRDFWLTTRLFGVGKHQAAEGVTIGMERSEVVDRLDMGDHPWGTQNPLPGGNSFVTYKIHFDEEDRVSEIEWSWVPH